MNKIFLNLLAIIGLVTLLSAHQAKPKRIVFFGDSITQAGVSPTGYITQMGDLLKQMGKSAEYELIGAGIGGNKVYDLHFRMEEDVLSKNPDVVVIYVGINDVWHKSSHGTGTDPDRFNRFYNAIIKKLKAQNIRVILCTPSVIGERFDHSNPQDGDLNAYSTFIRNIAKEQGLEVVDLRKIFQEYLVKNNTNNAEKNILTTDRVHLNEAGNKLVAESILKVMIK